jgi:hypothetical protein
MARDIDLRIAEFTRLVNAFEAAWDASVDGECEAISVADRALKRFTDDLYRSVAASVADLHVRAEVLVYWHDRLGSDAPAAHALELARAVRAVRGQYSSTLLPRKKSAGRCPSHHAAR